MMPPSELQMLDLGCKVYLMLGLYLIRFDLMKRECLFCVIVYGDLAWFFVFVFYLTGVSGLEFASLSLSGDSGVLSNVSSLITMGTPKVRGVAFYIMGWP